MKVCVLGAGVIGLTTAWELAERGVDVCLIDRHNEPGMEASFANGGQLSYSYVTPLASPETLVKMPGLLLSSAAPIRVRLSLDPHFVRWGMGFLKACTSRAVRETTAAQLALAQLSRAALLDLTVRLALDYGLRNAGKLIFYRSAANFAAACRQATLQAETGGTKQSILTPEECLDREPALIVRPAAIAGGIYTDTDQVGDCHAFCRDLGRHLRQHPRVTWMLGTTALGLSLAGNAVQGVQTSKGHILCDFVVLSLGAESVRFARPFGVHLPLYPMKGYSMTVPARAGGRALSHSVTDFDRKIVYAPIVEDRQPLVRVAGIADLVGHDRRLDPKRLDSMEQHAADTVAIGLGGDVRPWAGLRPATPDSRPIVGWSAVGGLLLNTGHGALGWTLACGSARLAAEMITRSPPSIEPRWFDLDRTL